MATERPDQRKKLIRNFDGCSLVRETITTPTRPFLPPSSDAPSASGEGTCLVPVSDPAEHTCRIDISITSPTKSLSIPRADAQQGSSSSDPVRAGATGISISSATCGITVLHQSLLQGIWEKAGKLLSQERGLQRAASSDPNAWSVMSLSSSVPHFVTSKEDGQFLCDAQCPQWVSAKICSHTVALAERSGKLAAFLHWYMYISTNQDTNITRLGMLNMPKGRGQKGGVPKRKRSRTKATEPEVVVSRPSRYKPRVRLLPAGTGHLQCSISISLLFNTLPWFHPFHQNSATHTTRQLFRLLNQPTPTRSI